MNRHGELVQDHTYYKVFWDDKWDSVDEYQDATEMVLDIEEAIKNGYRPYFGRISIYDKDAGLQETYPNLNEFKEAFGDWL